MHLPDIIGSIIAIIIILVTALFTDIRMSATDSDSREWQIAGGKKKSTRTRAPAAHSRTFAIFGDTGLKKDHLISLMQGIGFQQVSDASREKFINFVWVEMVWQHDRFFAFDKKSYGIRCTLKNILSDTKHIITNKARFHEEYARRFPDCRDIAITRALSAVSEIGSNEILIVRPVRLTNSVACSGNGIIRVTNAEELAAAKKRYPDSEDSREAQEPKANSREAQEPKANSREAQEPKANSREAQEPKANSREAQEPKANAIISKYIRNPLLWHNRENGRDYKFHLRMYWLVISGNTTQSILWNIAKILTAAKPYEDAHFEDAGIHDTHISSTTRSLFFPNDLGIPAADCETIFANAKRALRRVDEIYLPLAAPYSESRFAFEVFGVDVLVRRDLSTIILEINDRVGFSSVNGAYDAPYEEFTKKYFDWIYENAIHPVFSAQ
jgi:hypothetical protein